MTLEEAIAHEEYNAEHALCGECASGHRQLAMWLRELKRRREAPGSALPGRGQQPLVVADGFTDRPGYLRPS